MNPNNPQWSVDVYSGDAYTDSPYYDGNPRTRDRSANHLEIFDSPQPGPDDLQNGLANLRSRNIDTRNITSARMVYHFEDFLMRHGQAVYRLRWGAEYRFENPTVPREGADPPIRIFDEPRPDGEHPAPGPVNGLGDHMRGVLIRAYPGRTGMR
jgi:hypothetical protein